MKNCLLPLLLTLVSPLLVLADPAAARPDVEEMLTAMRVEKTMEMTMEQVKKMVPKMTEGMMAQTKLSPEEIKKSEKVQAKLLALIQQEMSWEKIKGDIIKVYAESLTPEEVQGITAFYKSKAGQAFLDKQPVILEKTMAWQQKLMADLMPKIQALVKAEMASPSPK